MRSLIVAAMLAAAAAAQAQTASAPQKIRLMLNVRTEGRQDRDATAARVMEELRRGLSAITDVSVTPDEARRVVWIVVGAQPGFYAASVMVTERYDRETLMVLGIEDDDMAARMMALQIVNDHQIFTGGDPAQLAQRIVAELDEGILARLRARSRTP